MDSFRREILVLVKRIVNELRGLGTNLLGVQKQIETAAKEQQTQEETKSPSPEMAAILNSLQGIQAEQKTGNASQDRHQTRNLIVSLAGVAVLLAYTIVNYKMLCAMRDANKTASDSFTKTLGQMKAQTIAQQKAADAAKRAADVARDTLVTEERAYVGIAVAEIKDLEEGKIPFARVVFFNSGRTPAKNSHGQAAVHIAADACSSLSDLLYPNPADESKYRLLIYPGIPTPAFQTTERGQPPPPGAIKKVINGTLRACVYGYEIYDDILGTGRETDYCYIYVPHPGSAIEAGKPYEACPFYNTMK